MAQGVEAEDNAELPDVAAWPDYLPVPHRRDLLPGKRLALSFVDAELPGAYENARDLFRRKGAYARFRHLLRETGALEKWYAFEAKATEVALVAWCADVGVAVVV